MTSKEFLEYLKEYYPNTIRLSMAEIRDRIITITDSERDSLKDSLIEHHSNRYKVVSVKEVFEAAQEKKIFFKQKNVVRYQHPGTQVKCPACGKIFQYRQGFEDCCPSCEFPYYEHLSFNAAPDDSNKETWGVYYREKLAFHRKIATTTATNRTQVLAG